MKRRVTAGLLTAAMMTMMLTGCAGSSGDKKESGKESYTIGIEQFAEHGSLDNCREGFLKGLESEGIVEGENLTIDYKNAAADMGTAGQISDSFVSDGVDMICAIATPAAQSAYNVAMDADIPVIYTAVTDPVEAELADADGNAEEYKKLAGDYEFEIVEKGITATADIPLATDELLGEVDCITNLTDNTVVSSLATILEKAGEKKISVFGSEIEQVKLGCLAAEGIDYISLGEQTGKMAAKVLKGEKKASEMKYEIITEPGFYVNTKVAENLGVEVPEELAKNAVESFHEISAE